MNRRIEVLEKSNNQIITLKYAKQYLRVDHDLDDEIIADMINVAIEMAENYIGKKIISSKLRMTIYGKLPFSLKLYYGPVSKINSIKIFRENESYYLSIDKFHLEEDGETLRINRHIISKQAEIEYYNGFDRKDFPASIRQGILEHLARIYDSRGTDQSLPNSSKNLYQAHKKIRINI